MRRLFAGILILTQMAIAAAAILLFVNTLRKPGAGQQEVIYLDNTKQGEIHVVKKEQKTGTNASQGDETFDSEFQEEMREEQTKKAVDKKADHWVLVNKENVLPEAYGVELHLLKCGQYVAEDIYEDLKNMLFDGERQVKGLSFLVASGYRTSTKQKNLLEEEIAKNIAAGMEQEQARKDALMTVAPAGYSEHETGLCVDIVAKTNQRLDDTQERTAENKWLQEHCAEYGFILRYPKGKEDITGFSYESWHFRYVGKEAAKAITEQGITLEEWLGEQQR